MGSRSTRSKKPSVTRVGDSLPEQTFFTDRDLGTIVPSRLRAAGFTIVSHEEIYPSSLGGGSTPDVEWLELCGARGWIALTRDNNITRDALARSVIVRSRARLFVVRGVLPHPELSALVVQASSAIARFVDSHRAPFLARIHRATRRSGRVEVVVTDVAL